jgi:large subunit ribosomal protein L10
MKTNIAEKEGLVEDLSSRLKDATAVYLVDYLGLNVEEVTTLRRQLRTEQVYYRVIKNTLLKRALAQSGIQGLDEFLHGPTAVAVGARDEIKPASVILDFAKKRKKDLPKFKSGYVDGHVVTTQEIAEIAKLPGRKELLSMLASALTAPVAKLAQTLNQLAAGIACVLQAVKDKKEKEQEKEQKKEEKS